MCASWILYFINFVLFSVVITAILVGSSGFHDFFEFIFFDSHVPFFGGLLFFGFMLGASAIWTQIFWRYGTETSETRIIRELEFGENADIIIDNRGMATIELENPINGKKSLDLKAEDVRTAIVNGTKSQLEAIKKRDVTKVMGLKFFREKILYEIRISPFGIPLERLDTSPSFLSLNIS